MRWVTRENVHLDRVASPWLIKRFVDPSATFCFVPWQHEHLAPPDAISFSLPGAKLGPHDDQGTTYAKIVQEYGISDPAALRVGRVVDLCVAHVLHGFRPDPADEDGQVAVGMLALAEGLALIERTDQALLDASFPSFDALYARYRMLAELARRCLAMPGGQDGRGPSARFELTRGLHDFLPPFPDAGQTPAREA